jgi:hypothetical protein
MNTIIEALEKATGRRISLRAADQSTDSRAADQSPERMLETLLEVAREIIRNIQPIEERLLHAATDHIKERVESEKARLAECLNIVDEYLLACNSLLRDGSQIRNHIVAFQERLSALGIASVTPPDPFSSGDFESVIQERIAALKSQGKL